MTAALAHRGPDNGAVVCSDGVALGARRLAIVDRRPAANQPMANCDGRLRIVHNGEIYNHRELRTELEARGHRITNGSDTAVVLAAYAEWGERCVERFNGIWAFAIWDSAKQRLFCSRDRFGVKPFYYRRDRERFSFASELKAFRFDSGFRLRPHLPAVRAYFEFEQIDCTDETFFEGIFSLRAGHNLIVDRGGVRSYPYWALGPGEQPPGDPAPLLRELFLDSVRLQTRTSVPVGISLSGGLDSSVLAVVMRSNCGQRPIRTFTCAFDNDDLPERPYAEAVVEQIDGDPHWVTFSARELVDNVDAVVEAHDEPFNSTSMIAQWFVMRAAGRAGMKVMLDGQGSDELFAGYDSLFGYRAADLLASGAWNELGRQIAAHRAITGTGLSLTSQRIARSLLPPEFERRLRALLLGGNKLIGSDLRAIPSHEPVKELAFDDRLRRKLGTMMVSTAIPELMHSLDRNAMAFGIEARVPYLDHRIVELAFSLDGGQIIADGHTKAILRRALGDVLPDVVLNRTRKLAYPTPSRRFFREELGELAEDIFASRSFAQRGWFDAASCRKRLAQHRASEIEAGDELWRALNLELWARTFIDRAPASPSALQTDVAPPSTLSTCPVV